MILYDHLSFLSNRSASVCTQGDLTPQVIKQVAHVQWFVDAGVAAVVELAGVQVPSLDETLGQHQRWTREFCVWNRQAFR
jgi:hypothetical protein